MPSVGVADEVCGHEVTLNGVGAQTNSVAVEGAEVFDHRGQRL
jgi:hypothetical protein